jgi:ubiquinone/menaquinone biosynthesis C-methylase UbiE
MTEDELTERLLRDAGVGPGMQVLDVGCAYGKVACIAAGLVGQQGRVLGLDRDEGLIAAARQRAAELELSNVSFAQGELERVATAHGLFDVAVGRRVLMYQTHPVAAVGGLARAVRAGGLVVFQELDSTLGPGLVTPLPEHERVRRWIWTMLEREGADVHMGFHLASVLERAGLCVEHVRAEAIVYTPNAPQKVGPMIRAILHRLVACGVATEAEIDVDTLDQRLADELRSANATFVSDFAFGAWARKPA